MRFRASFRTTMTLIGSAFLAACTPGSENGPVVLAASSMQEALEEAADEWGQRGHARPVLSFASSAAVARQASEGAPADIVITADEEWMDWLMERELLKPGTRRAIAENSLVIVGKRGSEDAEPPLLNDISPALLGESGAIAIAEPEAVPAGRYARVALVQLGLWDEVEKQLVPAENVRAALALVERGEADLGLVYASDAMASDAVWVIARFPAASHSEIRYPLAVLQASSHPQARAFADYLSSPEGQAVLRRHGFAAVD